MVSQTQDPRNQRWNKPKASTYSNIILAGLDENNHIVNLGISTYGLEEAQNYEKQYGSHLSEYQRTELLLFCHLLPQEVLDQVAELVGYVPVVETWPSGIKFTVMEPSP